MWSQAIAYNTTAVHGKLQSWADFWDLKRFPGKRGLRRSAKYTLEIALMADGVAPHDVYRVLATPEGVDRAFRKLDQIKADVVWWEAAPQPALFLEANKVAMSSSYTLYVDREIRHGKPIALAWNGSIYDFDHLAIPNGSPNAASAYRFINFASRPDRQKAFADEILYAPVNMKALATLSPARLEMTPSTSAHRKVALPLNIPFWIQYGPQLEARFAKWAPEVVRQEVEDHDDSPPVNGPGAEHDHDHGGSHAH